MTIRPLRILAGVYLVALHAALAWQLWPAPTPPAEVPRLPTMGPDAKAVMLRVYDSLDAQAPAGAALFFGDSIVQGLAVATVADRAVNFGITSATAIDLADAVPRVQALERAGVVYLAAGVNDVYMRKTAELEGRMRAVVAAVPAGVPMVWSAILPTTHPRVDAAAVATANAQFQAACAARPRCTWVPAPAWRAEYLLPDGVHLSGAGYAAWSSALRGAVQP